MSRAPNSAQHTELRSRPVAHATATVVLHRVAPRALDREVIHERQPVVEGDDVSALEVHAFGFDVPLTDR